MCNFLNTFHRSGFHRYLHALYVQESPSSAQLHKCHLRKPDNHTITTVGKFFNTIQTRATSVISHYKRHKASLATISLSIDIADGKCDMDKQQQTFVDKTHTMTGVLKLAVDESAKQYEEVGAVQFSRNSGSPDRGIRRLMEPVWQAYHDWFVSIGVKSRGEAEHLWKSFEPNEDVQRCVRELLRAEEEYNAFTKKVDEEIQLHEDTVSTRVPWA